MNTSTVSPTFAPFGISFFGNKTLLLSNGQELPVNSEIYTDVFSTSYQRVMIQNALDSHFKEYYFFGVSSYGNPPKDAYTLPDEIKPHRVLDPILWLFKRAKFID